MSRPAGGWTDAILDAGRLRADPVAHDVVAGMFDEGPDRIHIANRILLAVPPNGQLPDFTGAPADLVQSLTAYLTQTASLPSWAEVDRIKRSEDVFFDHGLLAILSLFNASLPETYVVPTIAEVLHISGQLQDRAEYRIRSTAAMIIPVMAHDGLSGPDGFGIGHLQRVRLIHGTIRHLVLKGKAATEEMEAANVRPTPGGALGAAVMPQNVQDEMRAVGWSEANDGAPINQEELAYVLLTFSYVFLLSFRRLGVRLTASQEEDYLHTWNVAGAILGVERDLMADTMDEARELFETIKTRAIRHREHMGDPRPELAAALINLIQNHIPSRFFRPVAPLVPRRLIGDASANVLRIDAHVSRMARVAFAIVMGAIDVGEWFTTHVLHSPGSPTRLVSRIVGYHLMKGLLLSETKPLVLPDSVMHPLLHQWEHDPDHGRIATWLEKRFTGVPLHLLPRRKNPSASGSARV